MRLVSIIAFCAALAGGGVIGAAETPSRRDKADHWSFKPVERPEPPRVAQAAWVRQPWDAFILASLKEHGLAPSVEADRRTLIRRASFNLIGLPPSPAEVEAFVTDPRPDAYERLVDQLLDSPRYGERWARHWLDVVGFGETHGFEVNTPRDHAWPYRDYVIRAFNQDLPYPRFIEDQLAGDLTGEDAATGFIVAKAALLPGQIGKDLESMLLARQDELNDMVLGTGATFLGLTVHCARCHDHKFDPLSQRDYYALTAFFSGVRHGDRPWRQAPAWLATNTAGATPSGASGTSIPSNAAPSSAAPPTNAPPRPPLVYAGLFTKPDEVFRLNRGDPMQKREPVAPSGPERLGPPLVVPPNATEPERRLALARWIADARNPLTARVLVNRLWHHHFGEGLVNTPSDFGNNGAPPANQPLLDWLASEFVRTGWSVKQMQRLLVTSATFRQSSRPRPEALAIDAGSRLLWRFPPRRLEAEAIRDAMLAVCGTLELRMGGPGYSPFAPNDNYVRVYDPRTEFGPTEWRRMIYQTKVRMAQDATFGPFDCPDAGQNQPKRPRSTTPIQALSLFNAGFVHQQAGEFAKRLQREAGRRTEAQVQHAFQLAFGRVPTPSEATLCADLATRHGLPTLCRTLLNLNEFVFVP